MVATGCTMYGAWVSGERQTKRNEGVHERSRRDANEVAGKPGHATTRARSEASVRRRHGNPLMTTTASMQAKSQAGTYPIPIATPLTRS